MANGDPPQRQASFEHLFEPCTFNEKPVRVRYTLTVVFRLESAP
jgi:hypothetical protein